MVLQFNLEVPLVVLQLLAGRSALSVQFWMGLTAARLPGGRFRHPLRIRLCMTSSSVGSDAKKNIYIYIYIYWKQVFKYRTLVGVSLSLTCLLSTTWRCPLFALPTS